MNKYNIDDSVQIIDCKDMDYTLDTEDIIKISSDTIFTIKHVLKNKSTDKYSYILYVPHYGQDFYVVVKEENLKMYDSEVEKFVKLLDTIRACAASNSDDVMSRIDLEKLRLKFSILLKTYEAR